jgi:hypothetical protein
VVEGFRVRTAHSQKCLGSRIGISEHIARRYSDECQSLGFEPLSPKFIASWPISGFVSETIHFDRQFGGGTIEIENVGSDGMLLSNSHFGSP